MSGLPKSKPNPKGERLQVVLARLGVASRRGVVTLIEAGRVTVNGEVVREKGHRVHADADKITVDGQTMAVESRREYRYFILNKPRGVMTTLQDPHAERTVADFFKDIPARLFPVGRLDRDTTGLLLLTNDGELAFRLTHPKFGVNKKYRAVVKGFLTAEKVRSLEAGVDLEEGRTAPCRIEIAEATPRESHVFVVLHEGKKRQIRRIFDSIGHRVVELERLSFGPLSLGRMRYGERRELTSSEVKQLEIAAGLRVSTQPEKRHDPKIKS